MQDREITLDTNHQSPRPLRAWVDDIEARLLKLERKVETLERKVDTLITTQWVSIGLGILSIILSLKKSN